MHAAGADYELAMVDVASDSLLGVPAAMVRALAELLSYETEGEGNVLEDVAARWAAEEDMPFGVRRGPRLCPAACADGRQCGRERPNRAVRLVVLTRAAGVSSRNPGVDLAQ